MHAPLFVPLVPVYFNAPGWGAWPEQSVEESEEVCTDVGSSVETEAPNQHAGDGDGDWQLAFVYDHPSWHQYEEGLWLKATRLPLLDACYIESDDGEYRPFGSVADFWRLAESIQGGIVVVVVSEMTAHVLRKGQEAERMTLKPGLRYLRCFPAYLGVLVLGEAQRRFAYLEATWRRDDKRVGRPNVQAELVMATLKGRDCCHVCFW
jgi:hypothetical protein